MHLCDRDEKRWNDVAACNHGNILVLFEEDAGLLALHIHVRNTNHLKVFNVAHLPVCVHVVSDSVDESSSAP